MNVVRDGGGGCGESSWVGVEEPHMEAVNGGELGDAGAHLAAAHHSDGLDFHHF